MSRAVPHSGTGAFQYPPEPAGMGARGWRTWIAMMLLGSGLLLGLG